MDSNQDVDKTLRKMYADAGANWKYREPYKKFAANVVEKDTLSAVLQETAAPRGAIKYDYKTTLGPLLEDLVACIEEELDPKEKSGIIEKIQKLKQLYDEFHYNDVSRSISIALSYAAKAS